MSDGKQLEEFVAFVECLHLPEGFQIETNRQVVNDDGIQIAELDIEIKGKVGTTEFYWLIECRDRPSSGAAPGGWIEQLVGRRLRFKINKVTAVSTTGFSAGAVEFAREAGIELREVKSLTPEDFTCLLSDGPMMHIDRRYGLLDYCLLIDPEESEDRRRALEEVICSIDGDTPFLRLSATGELLSTFAAFMDAADNEGTLFGSLQANGPAKDVDLQAGFAGSDCFVDTSAGAVRVRAIRFRGQLSIAQTPLPIVSAKRYELVGSGETVSQFIEFAPFGYRGIRYSIERHREGEDGPIHVRLRTK